MRSSSLTVRSASSSFIVVLFVSRHTESESTVRRENESVSEPCSRHSTTWSAARMSSLWSSKRRLASSFVRCGRSSASSWPHMMRRMCGSASPITLARRVSVDSIDLSSSAHAASGLSTRFGKGSAIERWSDMSVCMSTESRCEMMRPLSSSEPRASSSVCGAPSCFADGANLASTSTIHVSACMRARVDLLAERRVVLLGDAAPLRVDLVARRVELLERHRRRRRVLRAAEGGAPVAMRENALEKGAQGRRRKGDRARARGLGWAGVCARARATRAPRAKSRARTTSRCRRASPRAAASAATTAWRTAWRRARRWAA